jgi:predicted DNA-binding transcriptional regulator YafY
MLTDVDTAERLLALLGLLQHRWHWSADDLADRLGVTTRTVRRDVVRLRTYGYPVEAFGGRGGGYQLGRGGSLPPLLLDDDETLAVALGLGVVGAAAVAGIDDAAVSALGKIEQLLPARLRARLDDLSVATVTRPLDAAAERVDRRAFTALARATSGCLVVGFHYVDGHSVPSRRRVEPARLVHAGRHWYLAAFDIDRDDWRTFRVDRITEVELETGRFPLRDGPDPVELVARWAPTTAFAHRAVVRVECTASDARERIPPAIAEIESSAQDECTLIIGTDGLPWLTSYLFGLPWVFEVIEPLALRRLVLDRAAAIARPHRTARRPGKDARVT